MDKEEIIFWKEKYDTQEDFYNKGDEEILREKFQKNQLMDKEDLTIIIKWKFQGRLKGRQKRILNLLTSVSNENIIKLSQSAFKIKNDEKRLDLLSSIRGIGNALASVILSFYDPQNYGILDIHSWRGLFGKEPKDIFSNKKQAIKFFDKLREISSELNLPCRDIEKAIFKKDLDRNP